MKKLTIFTAILIVAANSYAQDTLVRSDATWIYSNREEPGWQQLNFDDSNWQPVLILNGACTVDCSIGGNHLNNIDLLPYSNPYAEKVFRRGYYR